MPKGHLSTILEKHNFLSNNKGPSPWRKAFNIHPYLLLLSNYCNCAVRTRQLTDTTGNTFIIRYNSGCPINSENIGPGQGFAGTLGDTETTTLAKAGEESKGAFFELLCNTFKFHRHIINYLLILP